MSATNGSQSRKEREWVVTEHRQIVVRADRPLLEADAFQIALGSPGTSVSLVVSDHIRRDIYPVLSADKDRKP